MSHTVPPLPPNFTSAGLLPVGTYPLTFAELRESLLVTGPRTARSPAWDEAWRRRLVDRGEILVRQLWKIGITEIFLDGSFVEEKDHPNDIDGYFECDLTYFASGQLERDLNVLDQYKVWTWDPHSRRPHRGFAKKQLPMWHRYRVELYPHTTGVHFGQDQHGNMIQFPAAFRRQRATGDEKGIVKILPP
jgi:hypothetical protein